MNEVTVINLEMFNKAGNIISARQTVFPQQNLEKKNDNYFYEILKNNIVG